MHYRHDSTGSAVGAWTRSAYSGNGSIFCLVYTDGTPHYSSADSSRALAPGFAA